MTTTVATMTDSEKILAIMEAVQMNPEEFARFLGLSSSQQIHNIKGGRHGISSKLARKITENIPEIDYGDLIHKDSNLQIENKGINIQSKGSNVKIQKGGQNEVRQLKQEIKSMKNQIKNLQTELTLYREREKMYLDLLKQ